MVSCSVWTIRLKSQCQSPHALSGRNSVLLASKLLSSGSTPHLCSTTWCCAGLYTFQFFFASWIPVRSYHWGTRRETGRTEEGTGHTSYCLHSLLVSVAPKRHFGFSPRLLLAIPEAASGVPVRGLSARRAPSPPVSLLGYWGLASGRQH